MARNTNSRNLSALLPFGNIDSVIASEAKQSSVAQQSSGPAKLRIASSLRCSQ
jgi:hypothetical protein